MIKALIFLCLSAHAHAGVLLQGFYWDAPSSWDQTWWDRLASQSYELSRSGFTSVWIPPVLKGASGGYSNGYDPFDDYDLGSKDQMGTIGTKWGTREQLQRAVAMMRSNGMEVYFDNVMGHRSGDNGYGEFFYRNAWGEARGGRFEKFGEFFSGFNPFGRQINFFHSSMRDQLIRAGDWLIKALDVQGMRIDMATNVDDSFLRTYLHQGAMTGKFTIAEYWSENLDELSHYVGARMGRRLSAFDFPLWGLLKEMGNGGGYFDMRRLVRAGLAGRMPEHAVTFVENHDTDRGFPTRSKHLGYAYILTSEGYPSVFWKDYFEYGMKGAIDPLIWIHEKLAHGPTEWRFSDPDLLVYERRGAQGLLVGLNDNTSSERREWVQTGFGGFVELHDYTGNGRGIRTEADGRVEIYVPANSYVAYAPRGLNWPHHLTSSRVTQQFAGARDLDIVPAVASQYTRAGRVWVEDGSLLEWELFLPDGFSGEMLLEILNPSGAVSLSDSTPLSWNSEKGSVRADAGTGWYEFRVKLDGVDESLEVPYWLNVTYQGPQKL